MTASTNGTTKTLTKSDAVLSSPGTREQKSTFTGIIGVTFLVGRAGGRAVLRPAHHRAHGDCMASSRPSARRHLTRLGAGLLLQALTIGIIAFVIGEIVTLALAHAIPAQVPLALESSRALTTFVGIILAAALGALVSLRRIARADPVTAIGAAG